MRLRTSLLAAALVTAGIAGGAHAAPPLCNLIVDDKGDAVYLAEPSNPNLDIVSGDVASDGKTIAVAIRVDKLAAQSQQSPLGQSFLINFSVKGSDVPLFVGARLYPTGNKFVFGYIADDPVLTISTRYVLGEAQGVLDTAKNEIRVWAPIAGFEAQAKIKPGAQLGGLTAESSAVMGQGVVPSQQVGPARAPLGGLLLPTDDAAGKSYIAGKKSCLAVGK